MVRRAKFADGSPKPLPKPERSFQDKLKTLKNVSQGISPESRIRLLDYFIQEALTKGQLTEEQASGIYNQLQLDKDKIRKQIDDYEPTITLPDPYFPQPTGEDYDTGYVVRYFLQKKGSRVIFEVSKDGFSFEDPNYHKCELKWKISGPLNDLNGISGIIDTNQRTVLLKRKEMPFIDSYLTDLTQLAKN